MAPQCARQDDVTLFVTHGYRWRLRGVVNSATHVYKPLAERNSTRYCAATLVRCPCVIPCRVNEPLPKNKEEPAPPLYFQQCSSNKWSFYTPGSAHLTHSEVWTTVSDSAALYTIHFSLLLYRTRPASEDWLEPTLYANLSAPSVSGLVR